MRSAPWLVLLVGCGTAPKPTPAPPVQPAPPPPSGETSLIERLHDRDGALPGLAEITLTRASNPTVCGGVEVTVHQRPTAGSDDAPLAAVYAVSFPTDLVFDAEHRERSLNEFNQWLDRMKHAADEATAHYEKRFAATLDPAALARIAQITDRFAALLLRAPIPADVRTGEFAAEQSKAYCDALATAAAPLVDRTDETLARCADLARGQPAGWWTSYCGVR